jgi:hypothetical protein
MKKSVIFSFLFFVCTVAYGQYRCVTQSSTKNSVTLRCIGYGSNAKKASKDAELNAIKTLLFVGADNTPYKFPLIGNDETSAEDNNKTFFDDFYSNSFRNFIESSIIVTSFGKDELKRKCITVDVCIRAQQLRTFLENKGIIRKFGL